MSELFQIRAALEKDQALIDSYTYQEGMDRLPSLEHVFVAVNENDQCVGLVRILPSPTLEDLSYINPIVVAKNWRGYGVGRALMNFAHSTCCEVRLVSRNTSLPFYLKLGYKVINWNDIEPEVNENCDGCPMKEECRPTPLSKIMTN